MAGPPNFTRLGWPAQLRAVPARVVPRHSGFVPKRSFFSLFFHFPFPQSCSFSTLRLFLLFRQAELRKGAKLCRTLRCNKKPGRRKLEARRATPTVRWASSQRLIEFSNIIATCTKSDECGTMMMLLHGNCNDGAVIFGIYTPIG
jgi:hypothetical protein